MFESVLTLNNVSYNKRITYKTLVSTGLIVVAVILPQLFHITLGRSGGVKWLPMYLPVLIGGCLLGVRWGLIVGTLSPLVSFIITTALGNPMPIAPRLPFMMIELAVFASVSGLFSNKMVDNGFWTFPSVILAQLCGRAVFLGTIAATQNFTPFTTGMIWEQIKTGFIGLTAQAIVVPVIIIFLRKILIKDKKND